LLVAIALAACTPSPARDAEASGGKPRALAELPDIDAVELGRHIGVLASDKFEGRAPGTPGETLTVEYLVSQFKGLGLSPGNTDGTYFQQVPLVGITGTGSPLVLREGASERRLAWGDDVVAWTKHVTERASIERSDMVFVGYGVVAPEHQWNDYKDLDVKGKTLVMLVNDPPVRRAGSSELDPELFGGEAMTYYGRWTYKFEIGAEKGAAGVLLIHETEPAGYPFSVVQGGNLGEKLDLVTPDKNMGRASIEGWIPVEQGRRLFEMAGLNFDALKAQARTREFQPVPLGVTATMEIRNRLRTIESQNVLAKLPGTDPVLRDQYVIYTAHWDHLGVGQAVGDDKIYNGAKDNASGTAGLVSVARAFTKLQTRPRRSILFLAVTAEEQGLLGSQYYASTPVYPLAQTVANINLDGLNVHGRTSDVILIGYGASDLDDYVHAAAREQNRRVKPDPEPQNGYYYRSDHVNFARRGVPALYTDEGVDGIGPTAEASMRLRREFTGLHYHKPSDDVKPDWDLSGAAEDLRLVFAVGYRVAEADRMPEWKPGNEFRATREAMLKAAGQAGGLF
jgi:Zn-dependent M28 family amino/carboxypeptidase